MTGDGPKMVVEEKDQKNPRDIHYDDDNYVSLGYFYNGEYKSIRLQRECIRKIK